MENIPSKKPYEYSTGEEAVTDTLEWQQQSDNTTKEKELAKQKERQEKFDAMSVGQTVLIRGMKESYKIVEKNPGTLKISIETINDRVSSYSFGTEVSVDEVIDFHS